MQTYQMKCYGTLPFLPSLRNLYEKFPPDTYSMMLLHFTQCHNSRRSCAIGCEKRFPKGCGVLFSWFLTKMQNPKHRKMWISAVCTRLEVSQRTTGFVGGKKSNGALSSAYVPTFVSFTASPKKRKSLLDLEDNKRQATHQRHQQSPKTETKKILLLQPLYTL